MGKYYLHLHVDVSGVEGATVPGAPAAVNQPFAALEAAAPYLQKGWPVVCSHHSDDKNLRMFATHWRRKFVTTHDVTGSYSRISPAEAAMINSLGLTYIVSGMRDGTITRFNPGGVPVQVKGKKWTKCAICGAVSRDHCSHLHFNISGVHGVDEAGATAVATPTAESEVGVLRGVAVNVAPSCIQCSVAPVNVCWHTNTSTLP
jgi:hypothetical protein